MIRNLIVIRRYGSSRLITMVVVHFELSCLIKLGLAEAVRGWRQDVVVVMVVDLLNG